jgi:hypothetical protein
MNEFSDLEAELKQLRPVAPSPDLMTRVERALVAEAPATSTPTAGVLPRPKVRVNWFALGAGLAAAAAFLLLARMPVEQSPAKQQTFAALTPAPSMSPTQSAGLVPEGVTRVVYNTRDEGLLFPAEAEQPVRRVRSRTRETLKWRDPGTGASLRVTYPAEEVDLIPVSGQ